MKRCGAALVRTVRKFAGIIKGTNKRFLHTSIDKNTVCSKTGRVSYQGYNILPLVHPKKVNKRRTYW